MRVDLADSPHRPWFLRVALGGIRRYVGSVPGPMLFMSYRPSLLTRPMASYIQRPMRKSQHWSRGEAELMSAFVSNLNRCSF